MVFDTFYHPKNMFLVITGNFNPDEAVAIVKENQNKKEFVEYKEPIVKREDETRGVIEEYKEIECNVEIPKVKIAYKMPIEVFGDIDPMLLNVYLSIVLRNNFGSTSLLREELLEKELVTSIGASRDIFNGLVTIEVGIETKYPSEVIPIVKEKMNNLTLTKEEIKRRIRANIAALINDYDDIEYVNSDICEGLVMYDKVFDDMYDVYNSLKLSVAKEVIDKIDTSDSTTVLLVPFKK
jgi:predicted Zn-dependent peptidase